MKDKTASTLFAGIARQMITPPVRTLLFGYATERPGNVIADDLNATALRTQPPWLLFRWIGMAILECGLESARTAVANVADFFRRQSRN